MNPRHLLVLLLAAMLTLSCASGSNASTANDAAPPADGNAPADSSGVDSGDSPPETMADEPAILLTIDLHVDPIQQVPDEARRKIFRERRDNAVWLLETLKGTGARITFLGVGEFFEYCREEEEREACFELLQALYESGGSIGTHTHYGIQLGTHDWPQLKGEVTEQEAAQSWEDAVTMIDGAITEALGLTDPAAIRDVNNIHGSHLPTDDAAYDALMRQYGFAVLESGPEEDFYGLFGHHIWNVYRPSPDNWMTENPNTPYVLVPSGPVVGLTQVHKGIEQDMGLPHVQTMFLQLLANWRHRVQTGATDQIWTFGVAMHTHDISEGSEVRAAISALVEWMNANFVGKTTLDGRVMARWEGRMAVSDVFESWESAHPEASAFAYPSTVRENSLYPYLLPIQTELEDAQWVATLDTPSPVTAYQFERNGVPIVLVWTDNAASATVDLSSVFPALSELTVIDGVDGSSATQPVTAIPVTGSSIVVRGEESPRGNRPDPPSPGSNPCGDGTCDDMEKSKPELCPEDCAG